MRQEGSEKIDVMLVQGEDRHGHFNCIDRPRGLLSPDDLERIKKNISMSEAVNFRGAANSPADQ